MTTHRRTASNDTPVMEPGWSDAALNPPVPPAAVQVVDNLKRRRSPARRSWARSFKASAGRWSPEGVKVTYRWLRNGKAIKGADVRRHRVVRADRGKLLQVVVTARKSGWKQDTGTSKPVRVRR